MVWEENVLKEKPSKNPKHSTKNRTTKTKQNSL